MRNDSPTPNADKAAVPVASTPLLAATAPTIAAQKGAATSRRHKAQRRADRLEEIRVQIANGTLVVRQMTVAQHEAASQTARVTRGRNDARRERTRTLYSSNP